MINPQISIHELAFFHQNWAQTPQTESSKQITEQLQRLVAA